MAERAYFLLGSNEGDRELLLRCGLDELTTAASDGRLSVSAIYETAAWGLEAQPSFLNLALGFDTSFSAHELLGPIRAIEAKYGRQRTLAWGQRTLDIDILFYGNQVIHQADLTVPHPRIAERRFALVPLAEIAGGLIHPELNRSIADLLAECKDPLPVTVLR